MYFCVGLVCNGDIEVGVEDGESEVCQEVYLGVGCIKFLFDWFEED